jgi:hypothetical protein
MVINGDIHGFFNGNWLFFLIIFYQNSGLMVMLMGYKMLM